MSDLEITKLCAEAMHGKAYVNEGAVFLHESKTLTFSEPRQQAKRYTVRYNPLHDDAQAMALVKKFQLGLFPYGDGAWDAKFYGNSGNKEAEAHHASDLNRAICECVAKLERGR